MVLLCSGMWISFCSGLLDAAEVGAKLESFLLSDLSNAPLSLQSYSGNIVVLVFWSFKCPVSLEYDERVEKLQKKYSDRGVVVRGVSPMDNNADEIRMNAKNLRIQYPIMMDPEGNLSEKLGVTHTPELFILDKSSVLRYRGALDNNKKPGESGRVAYAEDAVDAILAGRAITNPETKPFGCSIKRRTR